MENNIENMHPDIFNWIENRDFMSLSAEQQKGVLVFLSEREYNELHNAAANIKSVQQSVKAPRNAAIKGGLLQAFDYKHPVKANNIFPIAVLWKVAAIFLLFGSGWLCHYLMQCKRQSSYPLMAAVDTVYITKNIEQAPVKIFDTVYIGYDENRHAKKSAYNKIRDLNIESRDATNMVQGKNKSKLKVHDSAREVKKETRGRDDSLAKGSQL